jgi:seryl-tRNA synthetase
VDKRRHEESQSPAEITRKKSTKGSAGEVVAAAECEWERKANKLRDELSDLREKYRKLEGEFGSAKSRWESQRIQLVADEAKYKARAHQSSEELEKMQAEREKWLAEREELIAERDSLSQLAELATAQQATLEADTKKLREGAETAAKDIERLQERVTQLSCSVNYVLPTGKLRMRHQPSRSEVLWTPADPLPGHPKPSVEALNTMWGAVVNQLKQQQLELQEAWAFVEESLNSPKMDAYSALHGCVRAVVEAVSGVLVHHVGDHVSGVRPGKTLTKDLMDLPRRSRCSLEVVGRPADC